MVTLNEVIIAILDGIQFDAFGGNEVERLKVRAAARRLLARVETPCERAWGLCFEHPAVFAALQTCIDLGLWKSWTAIGGGEKSIDELVDLTKPTIETNLLRYLAKTFYKEPTDINVNNYSDSDPDGLNFFLL
ncbi:S-adenosyl-L-methionine-dependent methyltransferase [Penicillium sp. IBT 16267x]|nr:S-adenosyl-L-methionine-dependent methyltransferase [Penicillium sp. IBT 16267x]